MDGSWERGRDGEGKNNRAQVVIVCRAAPQKTRTGDRMVGPEIVKEQ